MKSPCITALFFLIFATAFSQPLKFKLKAGPEFDASRRSTLSGIVRHDATGIFAFREKTSAFGTPSFTLDYFNNGMELVSSADIEIEEDGRKADIHQLLQLDNKLFVFYSHTDKKTKHKVLWADEIDTKSLHPKNQKIKVADIDYSSNSARNTGFSVQVSRDSSKVLVNYQWMEKKQDPQTLGLGVFDSKLSPLWFRQITLPYKDELFDIERLRVGNDGNVYLLGKLYEGAHQEKRKGDANYTYEVIGWFTNGKDQSQYTIRLEGKFIADMEVEVLNNNLVCAGFYSYHGASALKELIVGNPSTSIRGTYSLMVDVVKKEIKSSNFKEFDIDFITQNLKKGDAKKAVRKDAKGQEVELANIALDRLIIGKDGSAILVGEYFNTREVAQTRRVGTTGSSRTIYKTHYYYNDIIAVKISPAGEILWAQKIAKSQHTVEDGGFFSSYALAIVSGRICFIFNDNPDNMDNESEGRPDNVVLRKSAVVMVSLDKEGKETKQPLFATKDIEVIIRPLVCEQISNKEVILFGQKGGNQQFVKLIFE